MIPERRVDDAAIEIVRVRLETLTEIVKGGFDKQELRGDALELRVRDLERWRAAQDATKVTEAGGKDWQLRIMLGFIAVLTLGTTLFQIVNTR